MNYRFLLFGSLCLFCQSVLAQELPHRMRVGLSGDLFGATLGVGVQLHGSFRVSDDYRAFQDRHHYINAGFGIGQGFLMGETRSHYLTYGIGKGRAMVEAGYTGVHVERIRRVTIPVSPTYSVEDRIYEWEYLPGFLIGYRYTAYSGFLFRAHLVSFVPGISVGWIF